MIETNQLTKRYGDLIAVNNINLKLSEGDVFGFIGPNGSGKTTTMRMYGDAASARLRRSLRLRQVDLHQPAEIRRLVGFMPDFFGVYDDMTVIELPRILRRRLPHQRPRSASRLRSEAGTRGHGLQTGRDGQSTLTRTDAAHRLARVLLHEPQVLLLDEPASGLDPRARIEIRNLLKKLGEMKKTVIVSSHILPELAESAPESA